MRLGFAGELRTILVRENPSLLVQDINAFPTTALSSMGVIIKSEPRDFLITRHGYVDFRTLGSKFIFPYSSIVFTVNVEPSFFHDMMVEGIMGEAVGDVEDEFANRMNTILDILVSKYHERYDNLHIKQWDFY